MCKFEEMCIAIHSDDTYHTKLSNQEKAKIWVGLADGHPVTFEVLNPNTHKIHLTWDNVISHMVSG